MLQHKFTEAGLGKAPFFIKGVFTGKAHPDEVSGSMGCTVCAYCSTAITNCFSIESADHKSFIVGSECVKKTGDKGMIDIVKRELSKMKDERDWQSWQDLMIRIKDFDKEIVSLLEPLPHPYMSGKTMFDYADWIVNHGWTMSSAKRVMSALRKAQKYGN